MSLTKTFVLAALAATTSAHLALREPPPFLNSLGGFAPGDPGVDNGPLDASGSNYPCKMSGPYDASGSTEYALGSTQTLAFTGSAVHGGGSCQVSITYDKNPTKESVFKVIHSIEGGCPAKNQAGNILPADNTLQTPDTYDFKVPDNIPTGEVVLAWTWFNRVGNREMYMTCAPITLTGEGGDMANFNALPDIMVANIGDNKCQVAEGNDVKFPNPGDAVSQFPFGEFQDVSSQEACSYNWMAGSGPGTQDPVSGGGDSGSGSGGDSGAGGGNDAANPTPTSAASGGDATATGVPGGVFITTTAGGDAATPTEPAATSTEAAADPTPTADPTTGGGDGGSTGGGSGGSGGAEGSACSSEGTFYCTGTGYQQCASGTWSAVMAMAPGTECTPGEGTTLNIVATKHKRGFRARAFRA